MGDLYEEVYSIKDTEIAFLKNRINLLEQRLKKYEKHGNESK